MRLLQGVHLLQSPTFFFSNFLLRTQQKFLPAIMEVNGDFPEVSSEEENSMMDYQISDSLSTRSTQTIGDDDTVIVFALETTSLQKHSDIVQIRAQSFETNQSWSSYLLPNKNIAQSMTATNNLRITKTSDGKRILTRDGIIVPTKNYKQGLREFYGFICSLSRDNAHLILTPNTPFYAQVLLKAFTKINITSEDLNDKGIWFSKSISIVRRDSVPANDSKHGIFIKKSFEDEHGKWLMTVEFESYNQHINNKKIAGTTKISMSPPLPSTPHDAIILFDLETTGLPRTSDICQISAQVLGEEEIWCQYLVPTEDIGLEATEVTGLAIKTNDKGERILCRNDIPLLEAKPYKDGLKCFYEYLCQLSMKQRALDPNARLILLAHNCKSFDAPILLNAFKNIDVRFKELQGLKVCFSDSLLIIRKIQYDGHPLLNAESPAFPLSNRKKEEESGPKLFRVSLSLTKIYFHLFEEEYGAHEATEDVKAMKRVLFHPDLGVNENTIKSNTFMFGETE